jgi:hypothetical protein
MTDFGPLVDLDDLNDEVPLVDLDDLGASDEETPAPATYDVYPRTEELECM